jgi:hypothetical protein
MTVFERLHMPSLGGAAGWLNSGPPGPAELAGHVVLANFRTESQMARLGAAQVGTPGASALLTVDVLRRRPP